MNKKLRSTFAERLRIVPARLWHLPGIFLLMHLAARDGFLSTALLEDSAQVSLLLRLVCAILFGYMHVPGHFFVRAKIRVAVIGETTIGHILLLQQRNNVELAVCAVQTAYRRCGVGRHLLDDAIFLAGKLPMDAVCMPKAHAMGMLLRKRGFIGESMMIGRGVSLRHWRLTPAALPSVTDQLSVK